jgi:diguanylate cyclase (GGDEF)-like protein/PAS domain S-box-containing protein
MINVKDGRYRLLLIAHDPTDAVVVREALADARDGPFEVEWVTQLSDGLERLRRTGVAAVLLDLAMPACPGVASFEQVLRVAPDIPILVLSSLEEEDIARQAVQLGAQEYLLRGHIDGHVLPRALRSIIERTATEAALFEEKERAEVTLNSIGDAVLSTDISGNVTYLNVVAERMTGWRLEEALGRPLEHVFRIVDGATRETSPNPMNLAVQLNKTTVGLTPNCVLIRRDGFESAIEDSAAPIHDRRGRVTGAVMVFRDVSAARAMSLQMSHLAGHDSLTDLPNRMLLNDRLTQAIASAGRHGYRLAVLFLDLDRFKHVNDSLGHEIGDKLLQSVAARLVTCVRRSDTVSRYGGDEFVVLLPQIEHAEDAAASAQKTIGALVTPHAVAHYDVHITASMGVSIYPDDGHDAQTLIKSANTAMYGAKERGRNNYQFFAPEMNARAMERHSIETGLRRALDRQEFVLHYQPMMNLETGRMTGAEALIRWMHPDRGLLLPKQFVSIAEDSGLILPIGRWVLREACGQARAWIDAGRPMAVAVNVSALEFRDRNFLDNVCTVLKESRLEPRYLELELTESVLMQHAEFTASVLQSLRDMGVQIAVDDFGTGYSSLSYLRKFPVDILKVDQSFVHEITADQGGAPIVSAVISMGKNLKHRVIAEGVESREQLAFLQAQHCGEGQGYCFSPPVAAARFAKLLKPGMSRTALQCMSGPVLD